MTPSMTLSLADPASESHPIAIPCRDMWNYSLRTLRRKYIHLDPLCRQPEDIRANRLYSCSWPSARHSTLSQFRIQKDRYHCPCHRQRTLLFLSIEHLLIDSLLNIGKYHRRRNTCFVSPEMVFQFLTQK